MKKFLSVFLSVAMILMLSVSVFAADNSTAVSIPTPEEIELYYSRAKLDKENKLMARALNTEATRSVAIDDDELLLLLGVACSFAEEHDDITAIHSIATRTYNGLATKITAADYVAILSNEKYTDTFKFAIMDIYSYVAKDPRVLSSDDLYVVDATLKNYITADNTLVVDALASIHDKSLISSAELQNIVENGDLSARQVALKTMCKVYPDDAYSSIKKVLSMEDENSALYRSAISFLPQLHGATDRVSEAVVLRIIDSVLRDTDNYYVMQTCVRALRNINSAAAAEVLTNHFSSVPVSFVNAYNSKSDFPVEVGTDISVREDSTTDRQGHAIYRDGVPVTGDWHTAIVMESNGPDHNSTNNGVAHARGMGKTTGYDSYSTYLGDNNFIGERYMSTMTNNTRASIRDVADELADAAIPYTAVELISVNIFAAEQYAISDIEKIRCDGFVEYAYESCGIRLQGTHTNWDISTRTGAASHGGVLLRPSTQYEVFDRSHLSNLLLENN